MKKTKNNEPGIVRPYNPNIKEKVEKEYSPMSDKKIVVIFFITAVCMGLVALAVAYKK